MTHHNMPFHLGVQIPNLWFEQLHSNSIPGFMKIVGICFGMSLIKTFIAAARYKTQCCFINSNHLLTRICYKFMGSILLLFDCTSGYLLMLAFMYKNIWLCISIIIGHVISYLLIGWLRIAATPDEREKRPIFVKRSESQMKRDSRLFDRPYSTAIERQNDVHLKLFNPNSKSNESDNTENGHQPEISSNTAPQEDTGLSMNARIEKPDTSHIDSQPESPENDALHPLINQSSGEDCDNKSSLFEELRRGSLMERYPVLKFHNNDIPAERDRKSSIDFDELDGLVQHLSQQ